MYMHISQVLPDFMFTKIPLPPSNAVPMKGFHDSVGLSM